MDGVAAELARGRFPAAEGGVEAVLRRVTLLHQAFELRAAAEPEAVVLIVGEERITCGELDVRANQLARFLIEQGVGPEVRVAICAERSAEMVVAMYAVLKAGGAYVPVDPAYPEERQANILADSGALLLLTQERLAGRIPATSARPVFLDRDWPRIDLYDAGPLPPLADERNLAYVIYTSGSTGRPKGVAIAHRSAVVLTRWSARIFSPAELAGVLGSTSICFDMSIFELFVTPALGGRVILADNALSLPGLPAAGEVTLINTVPSASAELARSGGIPPSVITVNLGGEALRSALVQRLYAAGSVRKVYNLYGPSEDTTYSTWALVQAGDQRPPSIGHLLDGSWGYLLDRDLDRVPGGEPGELYLAGEGLARGYLGRPDLTASRFVPDPFAVHPGERMYATGDLIRYRHDGELDYLGRIDHQVKIRGFRVELGEIEATLERHPTVGDTVVVALELGEEGETTDRVLVAYVVPKPGTAIAVPELQEHLRGQLASYMVPAHFVVMAALPLNPNGKVDRKALPQPEISGERPGLVAPRTPLEAALAEIWCEVLSVSGVGVEDHFFELGGHSLLAARVIARIHETLGHRLPPRALFDAPTVERLATLLTGLPAGEDLAEIPVARDRRWIASPGQEGMWFSDRLNAHLPIFTIPLRLDLEGPLNPRALQRSLAEVVRRHQALQVVFSDVNGRPEPVPADAVVDLPRLDLTALPGDLRARETERVAAALSTLHMDLERAPLLQGYLIERGERDHSLLIDMHHIAGDDWSTWVLAHDLAALYTAGVEGRSAALSPLPLQFSDYAAWQQEWLEGEEARGQLAFWRQRLAGAPESLDLPADHPRPPLQSFAGGLLVSALPPRDVQALLGAALRGNATLFMALLAVLDTLLYRYSGQEDLSVGAPIANRHRPGTQDLIGLFTNTVVLRADLHHGPSFSALLQQVRETVLEGLERQDFPFDRLVRELRPERRPSHPALAPVYLSYQNTPPLSRQLGPGLDLQLLELGNGTSKVDLTLYLRQQGGTLVAAWEYASALFDAPTIARLSGHFQVLLAAAAADPSRPVSELPLLTSGEREQLLVDWNQEAALGPGDASCLHQLFSAQARRTPDAVAVEDAARRLTYAELDQRSDRLARRLAALGAGPEVPFGVLMARSVDLVTALLAVLKAGGVYVPLDPAYPAQRLRLMLEDSGAALVLTRPELIASLAAELPPDIGAVFPDGDGEEQEPRPALPENLAYLIYTSGSTGRPKGVAIEHRAAVAFALWARQVFPPEDLAGVLAATSICFDLSVFEIFVTLAWGGRVLMADNALHLPSLPAAAEVTLINTVPSAMAELVRLDAIPAAVRTVNLAGEPLKRALVRGINERSGARVVNLYGPSEDTTYSTVSPVEEGSEREPTLGRPIAGTRAYLLDRGIQPVPVGVPGVIHLGGAGLSRGYLGRPELTAERFVPDPLSGMPGERLYFTGDLARYLPTGEIEYLGRVDHQVKVRGFRVELEEIETALLAHPQVQAAVLVARDQRLVAYVVARPETSPSAAELRAHLQERLPEYMVPTAWVFLAALPLTPNGKVDRKALPAPEESRAEVGSVAPRNPIESRLAAFWSEVLGIEGIGVHESFFELGGHSLLATQIASRVRRDFGTEIGVRQVFQTPTIAGLAAVIAGSLGTGAALPPVAIQAIPGESRLPLSYAQSRLWFLHQLEPASPVYNVPCLLRLHGRLDPAILDCALAEVVRRHEILRATFFALGGEPFQSVSSPRSSWLARVDFTALPADRRAAEKQRQATEAYARPFHLATGPLLRAALLQSGPEENLLALAFHHIAGDGWSIEILLRELFTLYSAFLDGRPSPLPELPFQYPAFARWQRDWLSGEELTGQLAYWQQRLEGAPRMLDLPADRPRPAMRSSRGRLLSFELPGELTGSLMELARELDATPFMLVLAACGALLGRYTGQDCLLVGSPVANRNRADIEGLIGCFVNTLVLRADLEGDPEFREIAERIRESTLDAQAHQDLPFEKLVEALQPERALSHTPLVQVMLVYQSPPADLPLPVGLSMEMLEPEVRSAKLDLTIFVQEESGGLRLGLQYSTDLFDPATIRRLAGHFETLLAGAVHRPDLRLSELPLLAASEVDQILAEWNGGPGAAPMGCVHELFALRARQRPDAPAVRYEDEVLTYGELDARAASLARRLQSLGVGPERAVAVCVERSLAMVVTILGVLKAGGAYVPLNPESPPERLGFVLADCGASVLLSQDELLETLPPFSGSVVRVTADGLLKGESEDAALDRPAGLEHLAYVIYTSGSTGRPKGVMVGHGNLASYLAGVLARMSLPAGASFATVSTLAADLGNTVIFASLVTGGCLHVISRSRLSDPAALADAFVRHPVDCLKIVPSHLSALLTSPQGAGCLPRRLLILGGEAAPPGLIQRVRELAPGCRVLNHYGPTETTVGVLTHEVEQRAPVPLGRPLAGTRVLVLDRSRGLMGLVPAGVPGELYVGGPQVTRGYLGRPDLTAERFVPDPWGDFYGQPGSRLYATGDRGRLLPDGAVEFLGRVDFQVKVRGFRVEPGDVEAALRLYPGVGEAVVAARDQRLIAYVVAHPGVELSASDLRAFLKERLPDPLVPTAWIFLPALPLTPNGKIDRQALPAPDELHSLAPTAAPRTPTEEMLAVVWAGVLGLERVGIHDSFFELGGHSLLAIRVLSRVRDSFGIELPLQHLFENPTVAGLAAIIDVAMDLAAVEIPRMEPAYRGRPLAASFAQESLWVLSLLDPASHVYNVPMAWRLSGPLSAAALEAGLEALLRRHEALRTHFVEIEGRPYQEISAPAPFALPRIDLSGLAEEERRAELARLVSAEAGQPFDLGRGPLLQVRLAVLGADEHALLLTAHHAVFDGWSERILTRELAALYEAALDSREPRLPELPVQYADFALWQRSWLRDAVVKRLLAWWRDELNGAPTVLELPTDRPRPPVQTFRGAWEDLEIPAQSATPILQLGRREGATTFITLLALFQMLMHRLSGQDDLLVGTPVANRSLPELERLIGYFVNSVVLRGRFDGAETFPQQLARVRETALSVISHQHLPFTRLAASLQAERDPSRNPIFQVLFSLDAPAAPLSLRGVNARPLPTGEPASKFDLSLGAMEVDGGLRLNLEYNLDLFDPATARRLLESFAAVLAEISADPGRRLDTVPLLPAAVVRELCAEADRTVGPPREPRRLHDLVSLQAARRPEALAVLTARGERLTYSEIDRRSTRLARFLIRQGVEAEMPVGVCLERSPELLIAVLGLLKAGGVYLPLDPGYPVDRLAFMLEDSGAPLVLVWERLTAKIPGGRWQVVPIDGMESTLMGESASGLAPVATPESLAYLIYTSGSTGRPKGVGVSHAAAAEHMEIAAGHFGLQDDDRMLSFSSLSFDASIEEIFAPLVCGAAVVLRDNDLWSSAEFLDQAAKLGVTMVDLPTAYWHHWAADCERIQPPPNLALQLVILGGEAMSGEAARRWWRSPLAGVSLINSYGPTEGVITSTALAVDAAAASSAGGTVPIGRALRGRSTWVLDRFGHPAPDGVAGELCLGGPLMARGYLGRPELTAERFVPDPFAGEPGARLYRTGDLVRRRPDGVLEFLGRVDRQLKVRGFRVEPGEIESALERHPAVREVAVDARPDSGGSQRLVAWIVPADPAAAPADLAGFLRGTLPDHMIPSAFVTLEELPLTPNGKVSLRALPTPELSGGDPESAALPRTPVEERLAALWQELLGLSRVGIQESFFSLGGHSLLATRLLSRVREAFGVEITFRALFTAPTIEEMAALLEDAGIDPSPMAGEAARRHRPERPPLSFSQQSLWLIERLQPAGGAYNLPTATRFEGALDVAALAAALAGLVHRHEALRTRFAETDGEPWQEVLPTPVAGPPLPLADLSGLPEGRREEEGLRIARAEAGRALDLAAGPLLRAALVRLGPAEHLFLLVLHHAVSDGWSDDILLRDFAALYEAAATGRPARLPRLPLQFADYAIWQREHLRGEALARLLAVWHQRLAGVPPLDLPTDHRRPPVWTFRGASRSLPLDVSATDLDRLARTRDATSFMVLLAAFQALLGRYTSQEDFAIGTPSANRTRQEFERLVGFFVNMLPLRADLSGAPAFSELLIRVRATALEAFAHQDVPFELLVEDLAPERDLGRNPLFQAVFQLGYAEPLAFPGLAARRFELGGSTAKFDLNLSVEQSDGRLTLFCEYPVDLFEDTTVQRLLGHFQILLAAAIAEPGIAIGDLPLLTAAEREQLLAGFNDTGSTSGPDVCLHQLFEEQVARTPDRTALVDPEGVRLTYGELNQRADRLAQRLRALGLGPERLAGVLMDRTADLIITLLAVLKAGGAYVPLDPSYPKSRVLLMLETARAAVLVTRCRLAEDLAGELPAGMQTVYLDPGWEMKPVETGESTAVLPDNLAYVIFTSGSTGVPKGVAIQHRSAVAMVRWAQAMYSPEEYAGMLASTSICFDMSVFEIFATLAAGGKILLAENALALPDLEVKDEVVLVDTVPSAMAELLRLGRLPASVRTVNLGGEALKGPLVQEIYAQLPNVERVVNVYGPSEDTTFSTFAVVPSQAEHPLIGRPLTGTVAHVLDEGMQPLPLGVPGALYLGGEGVTRGYLGRPDLTAERFVPNPYGPPGSRLYRVGDLVRYLPTGELDFLGRLDHQVKVRGFRIELGEIEAALTRHPDVEEAAVLAEPETGGGNRLIAYLQTARDLPAKDLRAFLNLSLPDYMIPAVFVQLGELPLTPNGKIDRRALAAMPLQVASAAVHDRAPQSYAETVLVGIWSRIFGRPVGVNDHFFDLGGHSLLAARVASRVREAFGIDLPMRRLFEQPTLAGLAASLEAALGIQTSPVSVHQDPVSGARPLSFAQRRLWFLDQLLPSSAVYNIPHPLSLEGELQPGVLAQALSEVVRRHQALRTTFPSLDGEPYQEIAPAGPVPLPLIDLGGLPEALRNAEAVVLTRMDMARPFDLGAGPLLRAALLRLGPESHRLLLTMHHIVSDGWSIEILTRELTALYEAFAQGLPSPLPELPMQYADFAAWQRRWLSGETFSRQLDFWRAELDGAPAGLDLPTDLPRPAVQTFNGAVRSMELPLGLSAEIRELCRREGVTLFMLLLAGFDALLARYSGQEDVLVGSPVANRHWAETEELIGFFVNTLVFRVKLSPVASFRSLLRQVRETALEAYDHQDLPFETLVEELQPERDLSRSPFFQVLLLVQPLQRQLPGLDFLKLSPIDEEGETAKFDLSLVVLERENALWTAVEYNTDLFEGATASRLLGHLGQLLAAAAGDPERDWRDLPLLTEAEREQLLVGFNDTGSTSGPDVCLHQLFEEQVARTPERTALVAPDGTRLTYRELNERAGRLARRLRALGLGPERLAGVLMDRTADLIITLMAVLKAGGAYAPLDPNYPQSRVLLMLETSRAAVLVTRRRLAEAFEAELPAGMQTLFLDPGWEAEEIAAPEPAPAALPDNLAYVIFTSGSTGVPKGVAIQHRSAVAMVRWAHAMYSPAEYAGMLASTSICFDMSVFEIFATLAIGGKILLAENALALPDLEAKDEVVLVDTVPSAMAELLRLGRLPASVRTVNLGGEPLKGSLVQEIYAQLPGVERVVNLYGPSEDTTFTSYAVVPRNAGHPLIGRPLTGEAAYVLDAAMRPVPIGIPGALYMGGEGVTRGYLHRPDLTADRFIPDPYGPPGSRLYRVGDLVRYLPTGELDFLGRLDHQVKVRGFRIELGEIESALTRHPEVQEAAVLALPDVLGGNRLIAYVESPRDLAAGELRAHLKRSLPDYMVPSAFVLLRGLPLTPNGKIDRRALAALAAMPLQAEGAKDEDQAPRTHAEAVLAGIWSEVFGRPVGVRDDFFDLGGHSLLATRVVSRVRKALGVELPVRRLFERPTVAGLAESVEAALGVGGAGALETAPPIEPIPRTGPLPLSFSQRRLWFLDQLDRGSAVYSIPYPLSLEGDLDPRVLRSALTEVVRRHEALRTTFPSLDGEPYQAIAPAAPFPLPVIDLAGLPETLRSAAAEALVEEESRRPFDLGCGPLFRAALLRLEPARHVLLVAMHHIVSDAWSLEILLRELAALYEAGTTGRPSPLPELPVQYADFAVWQRQWMGGGALSRQLEYWRRQLAGAPAGLDLPTDFPRPAVQTFEGSSRGAELPASLSAEVRAFCRREGVTLFMLLLAGFDVLLSRYSGQEDVLVGSPVANRNRAETEGLIGFFVNTLVLRLSLGGAASFQDVLRQAREVSLAAYGHQDLPFETLVEELRPQRDLSRSPFFQVLLSVQTAGRELPGFGGLKISGIDGESETAKFDLSLFVVDEETALRTAVEYNTDLFEGATAVRLLGHLGRLLTAAVSDPGQDWRDLPLLAGPEREQLLAGFNDTGSTSGPDLCLHQLFEAQVERTPERTALIDPEGVRLTYRELNARADRLARRLRALGLGPERLAGVLMDRAADLIVTLLAVHKAGGAYAPLDPNYPQSRVLLMLETSRAAVLVTRRRLAEDFAGELPAGLRTVFLDPGWEGEDVAIPEPSPEALPDNLAYVIFTSGSTGVPKGVAIQHRSAVAMVRWAHAMYSPEEYAGVLASTSICFDMSVFEIFATLATGGKILLAENALALPGLAARDEVVLVDTVPSAMAELLRAGRLPSTIRTVNLGGEALKGSLVQEIYAQLPSVERVVNLYGPSEDTTFTSYAVVPRNAAHPLIGRPLTGEAAYVLDAAMQPVPIGIPGGLYMGGEGVTRGYLHRPDLTAERFIPNPYGPPGSRLYRVGDLVRYLPTGELDFLGRLDHQVKVRGFRIELGEIESALTRHPDVEEAAVLAEPDAVGGGGNRLIAYVQTAKELPARDLRAFLKQSLPDYMIPSAFVLLGELPLTPNGKIDRRALAAMPSQPDTAAPEGGRAPRNYLEEVLAGIWSDLFGRPAGVGDNFFDLGGHSLLATRVVSRIRSVLDVELPLHQVFVAPTLEGLAAWIGKEIEERRGIPLPPIERVTREGVLPLSFAQQRLWFLDRLEPGTATFNLPAPLRLAGRLDVGALSRALDEIVRRHESLRTRFGEREGRGVQEIRPAAPVPLPWIDLAGLPAAVREPEAQRLAGAEARLPFDLARGPLLRATLLRLDAEDWLLLVTMHHIVTDGWSVDVFRRELRELYMAFAAGLQSPLPELPLQYPDFAVWQRSALSGEATAGLLEEWTRRFGTDLPPLRLPTDRPRPPVQTYPGSHRSLQLSPELSRELRQLSQRSGATLFMTLLAAFQALLHRHSGQERIVVGSPVAGRNRPELEGLIGFFVNTLVLPGDFAGGLAFRQLLESTREKALAAYACQDLPFDKLVEALQPVRNKSRSPLFQAMFLLHHEPPGKPLPAGSGDEIRLEPYDAGTDTSQFDLTLFAVETPEGLFTGVEYNADLFDAATMDRLLAQYRDFLEAAVADPEVRLEAVPLAPLTHAPQIATAPADAPVLEAKPESAVDARRDRLASRLSKLSPAQREAMERRLKGGAASAAPPTPTSGRCLVEIVPGASSNGRPPFFCIHPAGGDVLCFFPLARHVGVEQPFYGLQSRGLEDAGEPFATLEEMAAHYAQEIRGVQPRGPYRIGGWSFGGLAAFELARQLRALGEEVEQLVVIDTTPGLPEGPATEEPADDGDHTGWLLTIAEYIRGLRGQDLGVTAADLQPLDPEAQLRFFVERLQRAGVVHSGDSLAQLRRLLRVYRTNVRAFRLYAPGPYDGRITLVRAEGADFDPALGPDLGWEKLSPHPVDRQHVPGDHITLLAEPNVRALADWLRTRLGGSETS